MDTSFIVESVLGALIIITGFFLKTLHSDLKEDIKQTSENKAALELLKLQSEGQLEQLTKTTELQITNLTKSIDTLVKEMHTVNKAIMHLNGNFKMQSKGMADLFEKLMDTK